MQTGCMWTRDHLSSNEVSRKTNLAELVEALFLTFTSFPKKDSPSTSSGKSDNYEISITEIGTRRPAGHRVG